MKSEVRYHLVNFIKGAFEKLNDKHYEIAALRESKALIGNKHNEYLMKLTSEDLFMVGMQQKEDTKLKLKEIMDGYC